MCINYLSCNQEGIKAIQSENWEELQRRTLTLSLNNADPIQAFSAEIPAQVNTCEGFKIENF